MPKFLIERDIPGAGSLSPEQLHGIAEKSCSVLQDMGPRIQWVQSYVTDNKIYCIYIAPNEEMVREHAARGGFPANRVSEVKTVIDPTTAETVGPTNSVHISTVSGQSPVRNAREFSALPRPADFLFLYWQDCNYSVTLQPLCKVLLKSLKS